MTAADEIRSLINKAAAKPPASTLFPVNNISPEGVTVTLR